MAQITGVNRILKSDLPDSPGWFDPIISTLNSFLDTVLGALRGRLTFRDNFLCEYKEFTFAHGSELEILTVNNTYGGVMIVKPVNDPSANYAITSYMARQVKPKTVGVTINFAGAGTTAGKVGLIILG